MPLDFNFVTERLATGAGLSSQDDVQTLADAGITDVIDCRIEVDDTRLLASHPQISVLWDGTKDDGQHKSPEWFGKGLTFALAALAKPHRKVYVHCAQGMHRGPSMAYAILRAQGLSETTSKELIQAARPRANVRYKADADAAINALGY